MCEVLDQVLESLLGFLLCDMDTNRKRSFGQIIDQDVDSAKERNSNERIWPYKANTSLVLIGIHGSGKSSLAFLAATAYNRRLVDIERAFFERTGQSQAEHRKCVSIDEYHEHHHEVLKNALDEHSQGCVIVCSFADLEHGGDIILQDYSRHHPVIHITRDVKGIQLHMRVWSEDKTARMLAVSGPLLRSCSNFEFFNKTEIGPNGLPLSSDQVRTFVFLDFVWLSRGLHIVIHAYKGFR